MTVTFAASSPLPDYMPRVCRTDMNKANLSAPSSWRGTQRSRASVSACGLPARLGRGIARAGKEMADHPVETVAILAMAVAMVRLASRREQPIELTARLSRKRRRIAPIALMASICAIMLSGCSSLPELVVDFRPDPLSFACVCSDNLAIAGEQIAQERLRWTNSSRIQRPIS